MKKNNEVGVALKESEVEDYPNICVVLVLFMCFMYFSVPKKKTSQRLHIDAKRNITTSSRDP